MSTDINNPYPFEVLREVAIEQRLDTGRRPNYLRRAAGVAACTVAVTVGASLLPSFSDDTDNNIGPLQDEIGQEPLTTTYIANKGDTIYTITERELRDSGVSTGSSIFISSELIDQNIELNGGTDILPRQRVVVIDTPNKP